MTSISTNLGIEIDDTHATRIDDLADAAKFGAIPVAFVLTILDKLILQDVLFYLVRRDKVILLTIDLLRQRLT